MIHTVASIRNTPNAADHGLGGPASAAGVKNTVMAIARHSACPSWITNTAVSARHHQPGDRFRARHRVTGQSQRGDGHDQRELDQTQCVAQDHGRDEHHHRDQQQHQPQRATVEIRGEHLAHRGGKIGRVDVRGQRVADERSTTVTVWLSSHQDRFRLRNPSTARGNTWRSAYCARLEVWHITTSPPPGHRHRVDG